MRQKSMKSSRFDTVFERLAPVDAAAEGSPAQLPAGVIAATVPIAPRPIPLAMPVYSTSRNPEFRTAVPEDARGRIAEIGREVQALEENATRTHGESQRSGERLAEAVGSWEQECLRMGDTNVIFPCGSP